MSVKLDKKEFRKVALKTIKRSTKNSAKCSSYSILNTLERLIKFSNSHKILLYIPLKYEVDVCKIRRKLSKKCQFFAPFMVGLSLKMVRLRMPFLVSKFNVKQPLGIKRSDVRLDMAVVPVLGVDGAMARVGHGKGFYDRFFSSLPYRPKMIVFVQAKDFYIEQIMTQEHDVCGEFYITPRQNYIKRGIYDRSFNRLRSRCGGRWSRVCVCKKDK
ncbi:5-formyltetrahydrofolate cyclo-ligase [Campylobacter sp. faydin G-24]|uniref:5-formyltetrahydrofolate cyclo-ligase n=1 Tax=Campylobacter anatolicus TaxID=2829105 RepID=A0ABS5HHB2_9BACT|nr:5-formyltetrahydrofolate cyclo-ligase [Campylobacter anatolicus]MBR8463669.1 5-formyltetrahydrofolate cyclo-ligase [Campylobacter anatolicus]